MFRNFRNHRDLNSYLILVLILLIIAGLSALDYYFKYLYSKYGDVPFYRFDYHLIFITQWIITPLAIYPFVKRCNATIKKQGIAFYFYIGIGSLFLSFIVSIILFILIRIIFLGSLAISFAKILFNALDRTIAIGLPATSIFLGYFYMRSYADQKSLIETTEKAMIEAKLQQLNTGFEPHFLFNNLNILSELIDKDISKSQQFVHALASLYRYIITANKDNIVSLKNELDHAGNYLDIVNIKFNNAYSLNIEIDEDDDVFLLPNTMQLLIENVVKHNRANSKNPLQITITKNDEEIFVVNEKRKRVVNFAESTNSGLENLKERYLLTFDKQIKILEKDDTFSVIIPIMRDEN